MTIMDDTRWREAWLRVRPKTKLTPREQKRAARLAKRRAKTSRGN